MTNSARLLALISAFSFGAAHADAPRVVTDIPPTFGIVARVMEGVGTPDLILQSAVSAHDYALRPSEALMIERAEVVFWIGHDMTPWLGHSLETLGASAISVELLDTDGTNLLPFRENHIFEGDIDRDDHDDHDEHDEHDEHDGHDKHGHGSINPHAWLNPENAKMWAQHIAEILAERDPDNAETYRANADDLVSEIQETIENIQQAFGSAPMQEMLVYHDAYGYFEAQFNIPVSGAITDGHAARPGPQRLQSIADLINEHDIGCILIEPQTDPDAINNTFSGIDLRQVVIDPIGTRLEHNSRLYPALLQSVAQSFQNCAQGG